LSNLAGQRPHGLGKACPDPIVGKTAFVEAGVGMRDGELEIEYPGAEDRTLRSSACAQAAPKAPVLAPTTATGLFRSTFVATGRETQSIAFFSWPGMEALYSGVEKSTASAVAIAWFKRAPLVGRGWRSSSLS
jgi:hypothetical protein